MIVPDINLLIYAYNEQAPKHTEAKAWWEDCLNGEEIVGIPWIVISGYLRLITHSRVMVTPMPVNEATASVRKWTNQPLVRLIEPGSQFAHHFLKNLENLGTAGNLTTDAFIAAIAQENQAEVHSNDADFARFHGLRHKNPLTE